MKKIIYATMVALAGLAFAACNPTDVNEQGGGSSTKAPVLGTIEGAVLDIAGNDIVITFTEADFGQRVSIEYALYVDKVGNKMADKSLVKTEISGTNITITQANLSLAIQKLGFEVGEEAEVEFALYATVGSKELVSDYVKATFTVCAAEVDDNASFDRLYVIGALNSWSWDKVAEQNDFIYDYASNGVYSGLVYYRAQTNNIFKIAYPRTDDEGKLQWDDNANYGTLDGAVLTPEEYPIQLRCNGGSGNIDAFAYNFYLLSFDRNEMVLTVEEGTNWAATVPVRFDYMYVAGVGDDWTAFSAAQQMKYIPSKHKFCIDVNTEKEGSFKFLADGGYVGDQEWYLNWGIDDAGNLKMDGGNITLPAGKNRIYLSLNTYEYSIDSSKYGVDEGQEDVAIRETGVERPKKYYLRGSLYGDAEWKNGHELGANEDNTIYSIDGVELTADDEFKIVINNNWDEGSFGAAADVVVGEAFSVSKSGGNIKVGAAGGFDIAFNVEGSTVTIKKSASQDWSVIGDIEGGDAWGKDFAMTEKDGVWTSETLNIKGEFKIRKNGAWSQNRGVAEGVTPAVGTAFDTARNGGNIAGITGSHVVVYDANTDQITIK